MIVALHTYHIINRWPIAMEMLNGYSCALQPVYSSSRSALVRSDRVKSFHSKMMLCDVIAEREARSTAWVGCMARFLGRWMAHGTGPDNLQRSSDVADLMRLFMDQSENEGFGMVFCIVFLQASFGLAVSGMALLANAWMMVKKLKISRVWEMKTNESCLFYIQSIMFSASRLGSEELRSSSRLGTNVFEGRAEKVHGPSKGLWDCGRPGPITQIVHSW